MIIVTCSLLGMVTPFQSMLKPQIALAPRPISRPSRPPTFLGPISHAVYMLFTCCLYIACERLIAKNMRNRRSFHLGLPLIGL